MKFDELGCLIREKYEAGHPANLGDSCAETARHVILSGEPRPLSQFVTSAGFLRHPNSIWREDDTSADQVLPLILCRPWYAKGFRILIPGTMTIMSAGLWAAWHKHYRLLNVVNIVQGWLFTIEWRVADGGKVEPIEGQVQDWLNYLFVYFWLRDNGHWATLNQSKERCMKAIRKYYLEGPDAEPNGAWIVDLYERAFKSGTPPGGSLP